jgi:hypothetical protein
MLLLLTSSNNGASSLAISIAVGEYFLVPSLISMLYSQELVA